MANRYIGEKCKVCGEIFDEKQDIVVCPDCGTPYHRECWDKSGECINTELHEKGESWTPASKISYTPYTPAPGNEPIKCIRCGKENPPGQKFCAECGLPLNFSHEDPRPFNDQAADPFNSNHSPDQSGRLPYEGNTANLFGSAMQTIKLTPQSDMDGIKLGDLVNYIGSRSLSLISSFIKFAKTRQRVSLNLAALFIPELYFFYRKMIKQGIFFLLIGFILDIPSLIYNWQSGALTGMILFTTPIDIKSEKFLTIMQLCYSVKVGLGIFAGAYANYWYYKKARNDIGTIRSAVEIEEKEAEKQIRSKGGTSKGALVLSFAANLILQLALLLSLSIAFQPT